MAVIFSVPSSRLLDKSLWFIDVMQNRKVVFVIFFSIRHNINSKKKVKITRRLLVLQTSQTSHRENRTRNRAEFAVDDTNLQPATSYGITVTPLFLTLEAPQITTFRRPDFDLPTFSFYSTYSAYIDNNFQRECQCCHLPFSADCVLDTYFFIAEARHPFESLLPPPFVASVLFGPTVGKRERAPYACLVYFSNSYINVLLHP